MESSRDCSYKYLLTIEFFIGTFDIFGIQGSQGKGNRKKQIYLEKSKDLAKNKQKIKTLYTMKTITHVLIIQTEILEF